MIHFASKSFPRLRVKNLMGARFPETSRWESRALLPCALLQSIRLRRLQRTEDRCPNYLKSRWFLPQTIDLELFQRRALKARARLAKRDVPPANLRLAQAPF